MTTLVCGNCQAQLEADGSRFCMRCGAPLMPARSISMPLEGTAEHEAVPPTEPPQPPQLPQPSQIIRRAGRRPIEPPTPVQGVDALTVSRTWSSSRPLGERKPKLSRERKMAGDLPAWEPLPPGELNVRRPHA
ncbi:zinc ribbon domain-containing protein [Pseudoclavibacter helvolus]|uniref:zinc ribbon domain-containing protein n=1 Tax=Pseudoclavibacter helvolus TaxID=255205 RepID=UPI001428C80A